MKAIITETNEYEIEYDGNKCSPNCPQIDKKQLPYIWCRLCDDYIFENSRRCYIEGEDYNDGCKNETT